jgi:hypothetical protein
MTRRVISFEIDEEIAGHFDALVADWKKDPVSLARGFFEEEVLANTSGRRGVPVLRRYLYRDSSISFTREEFEALETERESNRDSVVEAEEQKHREELIAKMKKNRESRA